MSRDLVLGITTRNLTKFSWLRLEKKDPVVSGRKNRKVIILKHSHSILHNQRPALSGIYFARHYVTWEKEKWTILFPSGIKMSTDKCWRGCGEKGTLLHCWWGQKFIQPLWKIVWKLLKKLKIELPYDPAVPPLGIYLDKTTILKDICAPMFIVELFLIAKAWDQPKCLWIGEWLKEDVIHMYSGILPDHEKKLNKAICSNGLPWWLCSKESASQCRRFRFNFWVGKIPGKGNDSPLQYSCLGNRMDRGAWWATVHGVAKSQTWLGN